MTISQFQLNTFRAKRISGKRAYCSSSCLSLKRELEIYIYIFFIQMSLFQSSKTIPSDSQRTLGILSTPKALLYGLRTIFEQMTISKFLLDAFKESTTGGVGGPDHSDSYKGHFNIRSPIQWAHSVVYATNLSILTLYVIWVKLKTFALRTWGGGLSSSKTYFPDLSTALNKMACSEFWWDVFLELMGMQGEGACCPLITFDF